MTIEDGLVALLLADSGVSALVGTRIYPLKLPQDDGLPAIRFQRISGERVRTLDGPTGLVRPRIQIDAYGKTYAEAKAVAEAVEALLDGYSGPAGTDQIEAVSLETDRDLDENPLGEEAARVSMDFFVSYRKGA